MLRRALTLVRNVADATFSVSDAFWQWLPTVLRRQALWISLLPRVGYGLHETSVYHHWGASCLGLRVEGNVASATFVPRLSWWLETRPDRQP